VEQVSFGPEMKLKESRITINEIGENEDDDYNLERCSGWSWQNEWGSMFKS